MNTSNTRKSNVVATSIVILMVVVAMLFGYINNSMSTNVSAAAPSKAEAFDIDRVCAKWSEVGPHRIREAHCLPEAPVFAGFPAQKQQGKPVVVVEETPVVVIITTTTTNTVPTVTVTPPAPDAPKPTSDDTCKNKNAGKDGTPDECNAGKGQEKKAGK